MRVPTPFLAVIGASAGYGQVYRTQKHRKPLMRSPADDSKTLDVAGNDRLIMWGDIHGGWNQMCASTRPGPLDSSGSFVRSPFPPSVYPDVFGLASPGFTSRLGRPPLASSRELHQRRAAQSHDEGAPAPALLSPPHATEIRYYNWHKCLDYNFRDGYPVMWDCHGGSNQKWYFADGPQDTVSNTKAVRVAGQKRRSFERALSPRHCAAAPNVSALHSRTSIALAGRAEHQVAL